MNYSEIQSLYNSSLYQYVNNFTDLALGTHTVTGYAVDTEGQVNSTEEQSIVYAIPTTPIQSSSTGGTSSVTSPLAAVTTTIKQNITLNVSKTKCNETSLFNRIFSTCTDEGNGICDNGEWALLNKDCDLASGTFIYQMWVIRILLIIVAVLLFRKDENALGFGLVAVFLIFLNSQTGPILGTHSPDISCTNFDFIKNFGPCILPSQPMTGWIIFALGIAAILMLLNKPTKRRHK